MTNWNGVKYGKYNLLMNTAYSGVGVERRLCPTISDSGIVTPSSCLRRNGYLTSRPRCINLHPPEKQSFLQLFPNIHHEYAHGHDILILWTNAPRIRIITRRWKYSFIIISISLIYIYIYPIHFVRFFSPTIYQSERYSSEHEKWALLAARIGCLK